MEERKNPHPFWTWIVIATSVIQLLTVVEYYNMYRNLHDLALLQRTALQLQVETFETVNQTLGIQE